MIGRPWDFGRRSPGAFTARRAFTDDQVEFLNHLRRIVDVPTCEREVGVDDSLAGVGFGMRTRHFIKTTLTAVRRRVRPNIRWFPMHS
jgi:hypothetical protein